MRPMPLMPTLMLRAPSLDDSRSLEIYDGPVTAG
jgi:hypothetical protein